MKKLLILTLPIAVLVLGVTYAYFSDAINIGNWTSPNTVKTGTLDWNVYLPSELGWWYLPDITDGVYVPGTISLALIPEQPDVADANISVSGDTVTITLTNVYPGYAAVAHFVFINDGTIPSKLSNVSISINDPYGVAKDIRTAILITYNPNGNIQPIVGGLYIGYNLSDLPQLIEKTLDGVVFQPGGWIAFCIPNGTNVTISNVEINPNSGLPPDLIDALKNTDSFWIIIPPNSTPPQGAWLEFNITLTFTQFNAQ